MMMIIIIINFSFAESQVTQHTLYTALLYHIYAILELLCCERCLVEVVLLLRYAVSVALIHALLLQQLHGTLLKTLLHGGGAGLGDLVADLTQLGVEMRNLLVHVISTSAHSLTHIVDGGLGSLVAAAKNTVHCECVVVLMGFFVCFFFPSVVCSKHPRMN